MAIAKVLGTETEYGIAAVGAGLQSCARLVLADLDVRGLAPADPLGLRTGVAAPRRERLRTDPVTEVSDEDLGLANVILPNGARYYVDHAHPEYSTPECLTSRDLVVHDKAGERILERSLREVASQLPDSPALLIYKNNSDGKGNSYGTHENYLVDRQTAFADIVRDLTPFFVSRQVFCGAGKLGSEAPWDERGRPIYQLTQRADFFETEVGLETTLKRPIINTRDEPHADPRSIADCT